MVLSTSGTSFAAHIGERVVKALTAARSIRDPWKLSLHAALRIFDMKVVPVASYGIELIWPFLSKNDLKHLERVKPTFLKRAMSLHISTPSRLVYRLADTNWLVKDLKARFSLPNSAAYEAFTAERAAKDSEIPLEFFETVAMTSNSWKAINIATRHATLRYAVHGFHHLVCTNQARHQANDTCICKYCHSECELYHAGTCGPAPSLTNLAKKGSSRP